MKISHEVLLFVDDNDGADIVIITETANIIQTPWSVNSDNLYISVLSQDRNYWGWLVDAQARHSLLLFAEFRLQTALWRRMLRNARTHWDVMSWHSCHPVWSWPCVNWQHAEIAAMRLRTSLLDWVVVSQHRNSVTKHVCKLWVCFTQFQTSAVTYEICHTLSVLFSRNVLRVNLYLTPLWKTVAQRSRKP